MTDETTRLIVEYTNALKAYRATQARYALVARRGTLAHLQDLRQRLDDLHQLILDSQKAATIDV